MKKADKMKVYGDEFAKAVTHCRDQLGVTNWNEFKFELKRRTGIIIKPGTWQHVAPVFHKKHPPSGEILWVLESANIFKFSNGEAVTASKLLGIYYGVYDANGNPIPQLPQSATSTVS